MSSKFSAPPRASTTFFPPGGTPVDVAAGASGHATTFGPLWARGREGLPGGVRRVPVGAVAISGHAVAALDADGRLVAADCHNAAHLGAVLGVTDGAYDSGAEALVLTQYSIEHAGWAWQPGPVLVGAAGTLVQSAPAGAVFFQIVGYALSATRLHVSLQPPVQLA